MRSLFPFTTAALLFILAAGVAAAEPSQAEQEGRQLADELLSQLLAPPPSASLILEGPQLTNLLSQPLDSTLTLTGQNLGTFRFQASGSAITNTQTGIIRIQPKKGLRSEIPFRNEIVALNDNWRSVYQARTSPNSLVDLEIVQNGTNAVTCLLTCITNGVPAPTRVLDGNETATPFAGSDFWVCDLGLEFLHWPVQRIVKKEMRRSQSCIVLESVNPHPQPGAYSRVVAWIVRENSGIVVAEAYDEQGRLLKEFMPKDIKKIDGEYKLQDMVIKNLQTGSKTIIEFNLESK